MTNHNDQERALFEKAWQQAGFSRPGNFDPQRGMYVDDRIQGRFEGWKLARTQLPAGGAVPDEFAFEYRHANGEHHTVTVSREQVIEQMPDFLFEELCEKLCTCEPVGETNVVECCCDEYAEEFQLLAAPHPVSGEQKAVVRELSDTSRVPDDYRNQATGYRAGWNDCVRQYSAPPAAQEPKPDALRKRFSDIEDEIMAGKHNAQSVFTAMRTAALYIGQPAAQDVSGLPDRPTEEMKRAGANAMADAQRDGSSSFYAYAAVCWEAMVDAHRAQAQGGEAKPECKCSMRTRLVGDGCSVCNPDLAAEYAKDDDV